MKRLSIILAVVPMLFAACTQNTIPADPEFRVGRLQNGMTYYICHNELPEGCADFYIAHNVGALQEEDDQNGLAHIPARACRSSLQRTACASGTT